MKPKNGLWRMKAFMNKLVYPRINHRRRDKCVVLSCTLGHQSGGFSGPRIKSPKLKWSSVFECVS